MTDVELSRVSNGDAYLVAREANEPTGWLRTNAVVALEDWP